MARDSVDVDAHTRAKTPSSPGTTPLTPATTLSQLRSSPSSKVAHFVRSSFWDKAPDQQDRDAPLPRDESNDSLGLSLPSPYPIDGPKGPQSWSWADDHGQDDDDDDHRKGGRWARAAIEAAPPPAEMDKSTVAFPTSSSSTTMGDFYDSQRPEDSHAESSTATESSSSAASAPTALPRASSPPMARRRGHARNASTPLPSRGSARRGATTRPRYPPNSDDEDRDKSDNESGDAAGGGDETVRNIPPSPATTKASLTSRSYNTFRNMAVAWVPGSRQATPKEGRSPVLAPTSKELVPLPSDAEKQLVPLDEKASRRPIKLDRRRLDKAVGLAVEAAQAAEEDERVWKEKERKRRIKAAAREAARQEREQAAAAAEAGLMGRIRTISEYSGLGGADRGARFNSLPWARRKSGAGSATTTAAPSAKTSADNTADEGSSEEASSEDEESDEDNFSLSLYLSSLSYLLSALPAKEANHLPPKERDELRATLRQVMRDIGVDADVDEHRLAAAATANAALPAPPTNALTEEQREERLRELLEAELRRAEIRMLGHTGGPDGRSRSSSSSRKPAAAASSAQRSTLAGSIATSTLELTFAVAAAGVGLVGSGLQHLTNRSMPSTPHLGSNSGSGSDGDDEEDAGDETLQAHIVGEVPEDEKALTPTGQKAGKGGKVAPPSRPKSAPPAEQLPQRRHRTESRGLQWDLAMALASSTASTLYSSLSAAAEEARVVEEQQHHHELIDGQEPPLLMTEDRLVALSASFARSLKRSPLPSQLSSLSSQLLSLLHSLDERYSLRRRATDQALQRTKQGLAYVRRRGWHVSVVRAAWALMEMGVAGVQAYTEEDGERKEEVKEKPKAAVTVDLKSGKGGQKKKTR